jgi:two-component system sensor histidine kinase TctE
MIDTSLHRGLAVRLTAAITMLLILDALACYYTAAHFSNLVYDRWLIDSARSLSRAIKIQDQTVLFDLPHVARDIFQFDEIDKTYFRVTSARGDFIAGDAQLPNSGAVALGENRLTDTRIAGERARLVAISVRPTNDSTAILIEVAETLNKRARLQREVVLAMVAPQLGLLAIAIVLAWFGISLGLRPLTNLGIQLEARSHNNLAPVPEQGLPREARILVSKINDLLARLEQAMGAQKRFLLDAAHQLRTPLAAVLLYVERAERAYQTHGSPDGRHALGQLHNAANRATRLCQQLLALARAEPDVAVHFEPTDLVALARTIGEEWIARALAQQSDFGLAVPERDIVIMGNAGLLGDLISNLIDNALCYAGSGSRVTLTVHDSPTPSIVVEDDGPGIAPEERDRIFERFYRLQNPKVPGCGLGLAIVREIVKSHSGKIEVEPGQGSKGARFTISFAATK